MQRTEIEIFTALGTDGCELCQPLDNDGWFMARDLIDGEARATSWRPLAVRLVKMDDGRKLATCDAPWFGSHALVLGERAVDTLGDLLTSDGELLPLKCEDAKLWMYNPTTRLDALNVNATRAMRFDDRRIMHTQRHVFRPDRLLDVPAFKLTSVNGSATYLRSRFVEAWRAARLTGLEFEKVWSTLLL